MKDYDNALTDICILGGGLAGLSLALQCKQRMPEAKIRVLEKTPHPVPEAAFKVGESSVEVAAEYFANMLGLKEHIEKEQLPKMGLRFFFGANGNHAIEQRLELGGKRFPPTPSYQLDRGRFENFLAQKCQSEGVQFIDNVKVKDVTLNKGRQQHLVHYSDGGAQKTVSSRWLIDASGRAGILKRKLGLSKPSPHLASAAWFRVSEKINVDDWSNDTRWKEGHEGATSRWFSTNHLMGEGYWVWLIPLASGSTSVGIVADERVHPLRTYNSLDRAIAWLEKHEPQCASKIVPFLDQVQDFRAMKHYSHECTQVFSRHRWGLTGEAGTISRPLLFSRK